VDFSKNCCEVSATKPNGTELQLAPKDGKWGEGDFTGIDEGRSITLAAKDAAALAHWIKHIRQHIAYGQKYGSREEVDDSLQEVMAYQRQSVRPLWMKLQPRVSAMSDEGSEASISRASFSSSGTGPLPSGFEANNTKRLFCAEAFNMEDLGGDYPLKECWDLKISKPPVPDRSSWEGVFKDAPEALVEGLALNARYAHMGAKLDLKPGEPDPESAPNTAEDGCLLRVMEFINYYFMLQGRPRCWYGGVGPALAEMRMWLETKSGLFPGHFDNQGCFACPFGGNGGVADLLKNCWHTQATLNNGGFQWMSMTAAHNGHEFAPFTAPFGLQGVPIPPRAQRDELLHDKAYTSGSSAEQLEKMAEKLYGCGHGPFIVTYKRPAEDRLEQEKDPFYAWSKGQKQVDQVVPGNSSRVAVYPPPGMTIKGGYNGEKLGGRKGLPGEDLMALQAGVKPGMSLGGPTLKVHMYAIGDRSRYQGCQNVKLVELETGQDVPAWVSDAAAAPGSEYHLEVLHDMMNLSAAKVWVIPKAILTMNRTYQCSMMIVMDGEPINLCWSWTTFGPRVYDVPGPCPADPVRSLDWALESVSDMKMKPQYRNGKPIPSVICLAAGEYLVKARYIDPGAWLHIEGAGAEETVLHIEAPDDPETFEFPPELGAQGLRGRRTSYEYAWQNPEVPLFNMAYEYLSDKAAAHDGGGTDPNSWRPPRRIVTMSGVTIRHNVPLVLGNYGSVELVDCHVIGPLNEHRGGPQLSHPSNSPKVRLLEVTFQPAVLFEQADLDRDGLLSLAEVRSLIKKELPSLPEKDVVEYFELADSDRRGFLSRRAFEQVYLQLIFSVKAPVETTNR